MELCSPAILVAELELTDEDNVGRPSYVDELREERKKLEKNAAEIAAAREA